MNNEPYVKQDSNPEPLTFSMPEGAIDAHMHVIGPFDRFPLSPKSKYQPFAAPWAEQKEILIQKMGFCGFVVVAATCHGTDNTVVVDALEHMDGRAAGVVSITEDVSPEELTRMHENRSARRALCFPATHRKRSDFHQRDPPHRGKDRTDGLAHRPLFPSGLL